MLSKNVILIYSFPNKEKNGVINHLKTIYSLIHHKHADRHKQCLLNEMYPLRRRKGKPACK